MAQNNPDINEKPARLTTHDAGPDSTERNDNVHRPIDLNHASKDDLMRAAGVDEATAAHILHFRDHNRGFRDASDLDAIPDVPTEVKDRIRAHARFG